MEDWKEKLKQLGGLSESSESSEKDNKEEINTISPQEQILKIEIDKKRRGKTATIISGFLGTQKEIKELAKQLKSECGSGGAFRDDEILIQGDFREKITNKLIQLGYKVK